MIKNFQQKINLQTKVRKRNIDYFLAPNPVVKDFKRKIGIVNGIHPC